MDCVLLADDPDAYKQVAKWYFEQWLFDVPGMTIERVESKLASYINRETTPLMVLAKKENVLLGAAELKIREMDIYPEYEFWLGGVYVQEDARGEGVASQLVKDVIARAQKIGVKTLYLQTERLDGGVYLTLGFRIIECVNYKGCDVAVMSAEIDPLNH